MILDNNRVQIIELDLTTLCNAECPLCFRNYKNFPLKYRAVYYRPAEQIIEQVKSYCNVKSIYVIGQCSEPTTHPQVLSLIEQFKNMKLHVKMCTNGDLHDDQFWSKVGQVLSVDDEVWFTVCGSTQELHEKYRVNTQLERVLSHARALRQVKKIDCMKCIKFKYNCEDLASATFAKIAREFSKVEFIDTSYDEQAKYEKQFDFNIFMPTDEVMQKYQKLDKLASMMMQRDKKSVVCQSVIEDSIQIDAYGDVFPCYRFLEAEPCTKWSGDYNSITRCQHSCCKLCQADIVKYCQQHNMNSMI